MHNIVTASLTQKVLIVIGFIVCVLISTTNITYLSISPFNAYLVKDVDAQVSGEASIDISKPTKLPEKCGNCTKGNNTISQNGTDFISGYEGYAGKLNKCTSTAKTNCKIGDDQYGFYNDIVGYCTTGYGHLVAYMSCEDIDKLAANATAKKTKNELAWIKSKENATKDLNDKLKEYIDAVNKNVKVCLYQNEFDALVSFVFNVGETAFKQSTLLKEINQENFDNTRENLKMWNKVTDKTTKKLVESEGLTNRRNAEADLFEGCRSEEPTTTSSGCDGNVNTIGNFTGLCL